MKVNNTQAIDAFNRLAERQSSAAETEKQAGPFGFVADQVEISSQARAQLSSGPGTQAGDGDEPPQARIDAGDGDEPPLLRADAGDGDEPPVVTQDAGDGDEPPQLRRDAGDGDEPPGTH